jgi:hypothetical protein
MSLPQYRCVNNQALRFLFAKYVAKVVFLVSKIENVFEMASAFFASTCLASARSGQGVVSCQEIPQREFE